MLISFFTSGYPWDAVLSMTVAFIIAITVSMVIHENGHGYAALKCGDTTAKTRGRLTMNPLKHFDWIGLVTMLLVGFGWAKPVPVNPNNFKNRKNGIIFVSLAGILCNLILAGLFLLILYLGYPYFNVLYITDSIGLHLLGYTLYYLCVYMVLLNIMLAFFNFLPICPLDGFRFVDALLPPANDFSRFMYKYGNICLIALVGVCFVLSRIGLEEYSIFYQVQQLALRLIDMVTGG